MFAAFLVITQARSLPKRTVAKPEPEHIDAHPKYEFKYEVHNSHTGDQKFQKEARDGDKVDGEYSLIQPDGQRRIVSYNANDKYGFQAEVKYEYEKPVEKSTTTTVAPETTTKEDKKEKTTEAPKSKSISHPHPFYTHHVFPADTHGHHPRIYTTVIQSVFYPKDFED